MARKKVWIFIVVVMVLLLYQVNTVLKFGPTCLYSYVKLERFPKLNPSTDNTNITIVTAFFDLGTFEKGVGQNDIRSPDNYLHWACTLLFLQNPLVVLTDSKVMADELLQTPRTETWTGGGSLLSYTTGGEGRRGEWGRTRPSSVRTVHLVNRTTLKAFRRMSSVGRIFADPAYPKFFPNTVSPEYSCTQHAKFDAVEMAIARDEFKTKYFAWLDLGYFRDIDFRRRKFWITVPPDMDDSKVAACQVTDKEESKTPEDIFKNNEFWVGGGMFLATGQTFLKFIHEYRRALDYFMERGLANTDQQVLYSMYSASARKDLKVESRLQLFSWPYNSYRTCWFYFGYLCYREQ